MSLRIVNLAAEKSPKAKESASKEWVSYGDDNNYFEYLIDRYNGSAVNNAIISSVTDQIYGEGLSCTDSNKKPLDHAKMKSIFKADDLKRVAHDLKLLGQGAFNIVWNKGRTQILKAKHIPMQNLRPEKAEEGDIKAYYYSDDWSQYRKERYTPRRIEAFDGARGEESQLMVIKPYAAGYFYFSPVDYAGALQWAEIDEEIGPTSFSYSVPGLSSLSSEILPRVNVTLEKASLYSVSIVSKPTPERPYSPSSSRLSSPVGCSKIFSATTSPTISGTNVTVSSSSIAVTWKEEESLNDPILLHLTG